MGGVNRTAREGWPRKPSGEERKEEGMRREGRCVRQSGDQPREHCKWRL